MQSHNKVVELCEQGMAVEAKGQLVDALNLYMQAWEMRKNDFDACVAAHYVARHQKSPEETLYWNQEALAYADAVNNESVKSFYPSLYLNVCQSYERLGNKSEAKRFLDLAKSRIGDLPQSQYGDNLRRAIASVGERL